MTDRQTEIMLLLYRAKRQCDGGGGLTLPDGTKTPNRGWDSHAHYTLDWLIWEFERTFKAGALPFDMRHPDGLSEALGHITGLMTEQEIDVLTGVTRP